MALFEHTPELGLCFGVLVDSACGGVGAGGSWVFGVVWSTLGLGGDGEGEGQDRLRNGEGWSGGKGLYEVWKNCEEE